MSALFTSQVLINIGRALQADSTLKSLAVNYYGRGVSVVVGGYAQKLSSDDDAPFIWVYSEEDDSDVRGDGVLGFTAKVVLGICPQKDIPSTDVMFADGDDLVAKTDAVQNALLDILAIPEEGSETYVAVKAVTDASELKRAAATADLADSRTAASVGEFETMLERMGTLRTDAASVVSAVADVKAIVGEYPEFAEAVEAAEEAATAATESSAALATEVAKVEAAFDDFIEDPFISETEHERTTSQNGLMIYGAIRTIDLFKHRIIKILKTKSFGIPLESVTYKNQAVAHYPLDWSEISAHFQDTETMSTF